MIELNTNGYGEWTKEELVNEIRKLKKRKKYGIVWEDKPEVVSELCKSHLPILVGDKYREIISNKQSKYSNILIEGDNYHALSVLNYTHRGRIDVIYIDPPYNTGNAKEWKYNDRYVAIEDAYRHSKWLSFMKKRLNLAKNLLSETGIMYISIDENEFAQLKLLCDQIFGESNFIANFIRKKKSTSTNVRGVQVSSQADYVLCYGRTTRSKLNARVFSKEGRNYPFHDESGAYRTAVIEKKNSGGYKRDTMRFKILGQFPREGKRWQIGEDTARTLEEMNRFIIDNGMIKRKIYEFEDTDTFSAQPTILEDYGSTDSAQRVLDEILGEKGVFENPKPLELIRHLIEISEKTKETLVLDFFAGSGTTGHAVLEMNRSDGGNRSFILCTNNEDNNETGKKIATDICFPRLKNVMKGYKDKEGQEVDGLGGNLRYFNTDFVDATPTDINKKNLVERSTDMLCLKENCFNPISKDEYYTIFSGNHGKHLCIIYDDDGIPQCKDMIKKFGILTAVYIFTLDEGDKNDEFIDIQDLVEIKPIPASILNIYRRIFK